MCIDAAAPERIAPRTNTDEEEATSWPRISRSRWPAATIEITRALKDGIVTPDGVDLTVLTEMDSTTRHWRFLRNREFDMAETSASS